MTPTADIHTLPVWIWLSVTILIVGVVTLIYSQGNWRTTLSFVGLALLATFLATGYDWWNEYLTTHFIGQYDADGNPLVGAGGWSILMSEWPLWVIPSAFTAIVVIFIEWLVHYRQQQKKLVAPVIETEKIIPIHDINHQLEFSKAKQELVRLQEKLTTTIALTEQEIDKNLTLEIKLSQSEEQHQTEIITLNEKIELLELQLDEQKNKNEELITLTLQQAEQIVRLEAK